MSVGAALYGLTLAVAQQCMVDICTHGISLRPAAASTAADLLVCGFSCMQSHALEGHPAAEALQVLLTALHGLDGQQQAAVSFRRQSCNTRVNRWLLLLARGSCSYDACGASDVRQTLQHALAGSRFERDQVTA
jgi:hypothetical protein